MCVLLLVIFTAEQDVHISDTRTASRHQQYVCDVCDKTFSFQSRMERHMRTHTNERPFVCEICQRSFKELGKLKEHRLSHSGDLPHTCDICSKKFIYLSLLKTHMRSHTGERPFTCEVCKRRFAGSKHLSQHMLRHTRRRFPCQLCSKNFVRSDTLKTHMLTHMEDDLQDLKQEPHDVDSITGKADETHSSAMHQTREKLKLQWYVHLFFQCLSLQRDNLFGRICLGDYLSGCLCCLGSNF